MIEVDSLITSNDAIFIANNKNGSFILIFDSIESESDIKYISIEYETKDDPCSNFSIYKTNKEDLILNLRNILKNNNEFKIIKDEKKFKKFIYKDINSMEDDYDTNFIE